MGELVVDFLAEAANNELLSTQPTVATAKKTTVLNLLFLVGGS